MPIHYSRTKFSGHLNLNTDVRPSLRWVSPDEVFGITGFGAVNVPLVVAVRNLPAATFTIIDGELPQGVAIVGSAIVGNTLGIASGVHNITIRAKSRHLFADREFQLAVVGGDYEFRWITETGLIDGSNESEPTAAKVVAHDPLNLPISYRRIGGPIPTGTVLNANGVFTGDYGFVDNDTDYTFTVEADNGFLKIEREFTISVWDTPPADAPVWETPKGDLGRFYEGMDIHEFLEANSPNGEEITYQIKGGSPPLGTQLYANGVVSGLLDEVEDDTTFRITVGASNDGGEHFSKRLFEITVLQNYPPEWVTPEGILITEVEGYDLDLTLLATDQNSPDQTVYYDLRGTLPAPLTLDPYTGKITGEMPPVEGQETQTFQFAVAATDTLKESVRTFKILNAKDVPPLFNAGDSNTVVEYFGLEKEFLTTEPDPAYDPNGKPILYSITGGALPPGFSLDTATGAVSGILPAAPTEDLVYNFVLTVADKKFNANINVRITSWMNTPPVWETTDIGFGIESKFFERQLVAPDRELKTVTFSIVGGNFPDELDLDPDGRIAGLLPPCPADDDLIYDFDVEANDGILSSVQHFTLVVQKNRPPVWETPAGDLGTPTLGQKVFSYTLVAVDPNEQPVTYQLLSIERSNYQGTGAVNDIIDWSFNPTTGTIGGRMGHTFTEDITYTIRVAALDGDHPLENNPSVVREFTFERKINTPPVWVSEPLLLDTWERSLVDIPLEAIDPQGQEVAYTRENSGGPIYRNDFLQGILNLTGGRIVGRLPFGTEDREISFWVDADDNTHPQDDFYKTRRTFTIIARYNEPPVFQTPAGLFIKRVENEIISYNVVASGRGNADRITYTMTGGALPAGVTMDDYGHVSGQFPMVAGDEDESYTFTVTADNGTKTSERTFEVIVEKNLAPIWDTEIGEIHNSLGNIFMSTSIKATDPNEDRGRPIRYSAVGLPPRVSIDEVTGVISGKLPLEFFETAYPFVGYATDGLETIQRNFMIRGLHNEPMVWQTEEGMFAWPLDDLDPYSTRVIALDPEEEELTYTLVSGAMPEGLTFHANGVINGYTHSVLADEDYSFVVNVADSYYNEDRSFVLRIVDNLPPEWITPAGQLVSVLGGEEVSIRVEAVDAYAETEVTYSVQGSLPPGVQLNGETGILRGRIDKLFQPDNVYQFIIVASDGVFNVPRSFEIEVLQNRPPMFTTPPGLLGEVHVNSSATWTIVATDDHDRPITYSIASDKFPPGFSLDANTGVISGTADFVEPETFSFSIRAHDGIWDAEMGYSVRVLNDAPVWLTPADLGVVNEQTEVNVTILATDPEGHAVTYEDRSMIEGLSLSSTGVLTGRLPEVTEDSILSFRAVAKDDNVYSEVRQFFFDVKFVSPPVWQTPSALPAGTEQYAYTASLSALSNNQTVTYQVVSGVFPSTLTLDPDGTISGELPVTEGGEIYTFEVEATAGGKRSSQEFTLEVLENLAPVWTTPAAVPTVAQKTPDYTYNFAATDPNGTPLVYSFVSGLIPPGLTFDFGPTGSYAVLSGDVDAAADDTIYTFMLGVDDGFIRTDRTFSMTVTGNKPPVWEANSGQVDEPIEGSSYSYTFLATDPEGDEVTYSLVSDTIPTIPDSNPVAKYLTFDPVSRTMSTGAGYLPMVTQDTLWSFTLRATDPDGKSSDATYSILIKNDASRFDPLAPYVTSLIHFDGSNGQVGSVKDMADPARVLTFHGAASIQTAQKKFGSGSLRVTGANGMVSFPTSEDTELESTATPEWTMELWVNPDAIQTNPNSNLYHIGYAGASNNSYHRVGIIYTYPANTASFRVVTGAGGYNLSFGGITPGVWTHLAAARSADGTIRTFKNGVLVESRANCLIRTLMGASATPSVHIGGSIGFGVYDFAGSIDECRLTKKCRYVSGFATANSPYPAPPYFSTAKNFVVGVGDELSAPSSINLVSATVQEQNAMSVPPVYSVATPGYTINPVNGALAFPAYPTALDVTTDHTVLVQATDTNGNASRFWPVIVRSRAASSSDLKVQFRMSANAAATKSTNPGAPVTIETIDSVTVNLQPAPAPYSDVQAMRFSSRVNYNMQNNFTFLSGDSTVEMWVYPTTLTNNMVLWSVGGTAARLILHTVTDPYLTMPPSGKLVFQYGGNTDQVAEGGGDLVAGQWNHVAYTRSGNTIRLFVNGKGGAPITAPGHNFSSQKFSFNGMSALSGGVSPGLYMRSVNFWSTVQYFGDFTPAWPNYNGQTVDAPDIYFTFNRAPGSTVTADRGLVTNITAPANLSYVNDGSRYVLNMPDSNAMVKFNTDFSFLEGNHTFECWVKWIQPQLRGYQTVFDIGGELSSSFYRIYTTNNGGSSYGPITMTFNSSTATFPGSMAPGVWSHLAMVKTGNTIRCFHNGIAGATVPVSSTNVGAFMQNKQATINGYTLTNSWTGPAQMANVGFWKTAKYSANFTPNPR